MDTHTLMTVHSLTVVLTELNAVFLTKSECVSITAAGPRCLPPFIPEPEPVPSKSYALFLYC